MKRERSEAELQPSLDIIIAWLHGLPSAPDRLAADTALIEQGILDSIELLNLVGFIEERFGVAVPVEAFVPENFATPAAIAALIGSLRATEAA